MTIMALTAYVEIFFNSEVKVEINDENYTRKKLHVCQKVLKF